jgi:hypothetical protein
MSANYDRVSLPNTLALLEGDDDEGVQANVLVDEVEHSPEHVGRKLTSSEELMDAPNTARLLVSPRKEVVVNIPSSASWSSSSEGKMRGKTKKFPRAVIGNVGRVSSARVVPMIPPPPRGPSRRREVVVNIPSSASWSSSSEGKVRGKPRKFPRAVMSNVRRVSSARVVPMIPPPPRGPSRRREVVVNISPRARWSSSSEGKMRGKTRKFPRAVMSNVRRFPSALVVPMIPAPPNGRVRRAPRDVDNWVLLNGGPTIRRGPIVAPEQATRYNQPTRYNPIATRYNQPTRYNPIATRYNQPTRYNPIARRQLTPPSSSLSSSSSIYPPLIRPLTRRRARQSVILPRRSSSSRSSRSSRSSGPSPRSSSSRP